MYLYAHNYSNYYIIPNYFNVPIHKRNIFLGSDKNRLLVVGIIWDLSSMALLNYSFNTVISKMLNVKRREKRIPPIETKQNTKTTNMIICLVINILLTCLTYHTNCRTQIINLFMNIIIMVIYKFLKYAWWINHIRSCIIGIL